MKLNSMEWKRRVCHGCARGAFGFIAVAAVVVAVSSQREIRTPVLWTDDSFYLSFISWSKYIHSLSVLLHKCICDDCVHMRHLYCIVSIYYIYTRLYAMIMMPSIYSACDLRWKSIFLIYVIYLLLRTSIHSMHTLHLLHQQ